jgi:hypothetical protein
MDEDESDVDTPSRALVFRAMGKFSVRPFLRVKAIQVSTARNFERSQRNWRADKFGCDEN